MSAESLKEACGVVINSDDLALDSDLQTATITDEAKDVTPKKKRKREKRPPDPTDPAVIAAAAAIHTAKLEAEAAAIAAAEEAAIPTPMENAKYYASLVLG